MIVMEISEAQATFNAARKQVEQVVVGKPMPILLAFTALLAGGHVLFEDIPGVGKTTLVQTIAKTLDIPFSRIQFTPDMLPSDVLGTSIFNRATNAFEFQRGPIFTSVLLADEINRATPRTQALYWKPWVKAELLSMVALIRFRLTFSSWQRRIPPITPAPIRYQRRN